MKGLPFTHLHVHTVWSLFEGAARPEDLAARAREMGYTALALTDTDALFGAVRFARACVEHGVRPIFGAEVSLEGPLGRRWSRPRTCRGGARRVLLLARDERGYVSLSRLLTRIHLSGRARVPSVYPGEAFRASEPEERVGISREELARETEGLVLLAGVWSDVGALLRRDEERRALEAAGAYLEAFGRGSFFLEVSDLMEGEGRKVVRGLLDLARRLGVRAVATNPVHYLLPGDAPLHDLLVAMGKQGPVKLGERRNAEGYLKPLEEMEELFREEPDLLRNAAGLAEELEGGPPLGSKYYPEVEGAEERLVTEVRRGLEGKGLAGVGRYEARASRELEVILSLGYAGYFLTVAEVAREARAMGIRVACRGSAVGSLVCYLLGISEVDPLPSGLLFERFLNPLRPDPPDIDLDVESDRREEVYRRILQLHPGRVAAVAVFETFRVRGAVREAGKALGLPREELARVAESLPNVSPRALGEVVMSLPEVRRANLRSSSWDLLFRLVERLDGVPRQVAMHPSGIALSGGDPCLRAPLTLTAAGIPALQADKDDTEALGFLKLDVIGVRMLSALRHAVSQAERVSGERVDLGCLGDGDPATYALLRSGKTVGCFQLESPGQRNLVTRLKPGNLQELAVEISLFRPGPVRADMVRPYLRRRWGEEPVRYPHPLLRSILAESYGVLVFQEQAMKLISAVAGVSLAEADRIRRRLEREEEREELRRWFFRAGEEEGYEEKVVEEVWESLSAFAAFGFCKAHAVAFALPAYQSAWMKAHHPAAFYAGVLTYEPGMYPRRVVLAEARRAGIPVLPLDINASSREYTAERLPGGAVGLRIGFLHLRGISEAEIAAILEERGRGSFRGLEDFLSRVPRSSVSRPTLEALVRAGAFDEVEGLTEGGGGSGRTRRDLLVFLAEVLERGEASWHPGPLPLGLRPYSPEERVREELNLLGEEISYDLLHLLRPRLNALGDLTPSSLLDRLPPGQRVLVGGVKVMIQTPPTRSGRRVAFLTLDDGDGLVDVAFSGRPLERYAHVIFGSRVLVVAGRVVGEGTFRLVGLEAHPC